MIVLLVLATVMLLALALLRNRQPAANSRDLLQLLPVWKVEQDYLLSRNGDITACFQLRLPEIFSLSAEEYQHLHQRWLKAIRLLPPHTLLHKQDWFVQRTYQAPFADSAFLNHQDDRFFHERPFLDHSCYLLITFTGTEIKKGRSAGSDLLRKSLLSPRQADPARLQKANEVLGAFQRILSDSDQLDMQRLKGDALIGTREQPGLLERSLFLLPAKQHSSLQDIIFKPEWQIGDQYCQLFTLADVEHLPAACAPHMRYEPYSEGAQEFPAGFAAPVGQLLPCNHIYNQYLRIEDTSSRLKQLESKQRRLHSLSRYSRENALSREATAAFLNEAIEKNRQPVQAHFNLLCWTDDYRQRSQLHNQTAAALSQMNALAHQEIYEAPLLWWAGLPGGAGQLPGHACFSTFADQACCFFNMETAYRSSPSRFGLRLGDRLSGVPVQVDLSDAPLQQGITTNRNKIVIGGSGSGKSMFMNHLLHAYVQQGAHCLVVDVGHSYEGLCELLGGYYFTYSEANPVRFNPFYQPGGGKPDTEKKESIKTLLAGLWKQNEEPFTRAEYVAISNALSGYYAHLENHPDGFPCFDTFYEYLQDHFARQLEAEAVRAGDFDLQNFLYVLRPYYKGGEFDYLLNATENLDIMAQPFIVFELDNIKDHPILFPVITLIIMEMFISKMRRLQGIRKVIVIEEAWKAIAKSGMATFMKYLYKTVRKHFGEAVTVTQEVDDLIGSPIIQEAIINNADCKILLDMKKFRNKFDRIQSVLGMTDKGRDMVLSLNKANDPHYRYREVYIELGNQLMKVYRYEPNPAAYYAYSTEQKDKVKVQAYARKYGSLKKGLLVLAAEARTNAKHHNS